MDPILENEVVKKAKFKTVLMEQISPSNLCGGKHIFINQAISLEGTF